MRAYITICTDDKYIPGVVALNRSLKKVKTSIPFYLLCTNYVSLSSMKQLKKEGVQILIADPVNPSNYVRKQNCLNGSSNWDNTFFKLRVFGLTQFEKLVYLDSDMIVLENIDCLFDMPHMSAVQAGHDFNRSWVQLNSGLMVLNPNIDLEQQLLSLVREKPDSEILNGQGIGDQDIINQYYKDWPSHKELHLPETFNQFGTLIPQYLHKKKLHSFNDIKVIHFVGKTKPWDYGLVDYAKIIARAIRYRSLKEFKAVALFRSLS